jgi:uncharacterized membrane protein
MSGGSNAAGPRPPAAGSASAWPRWARSSRSTASSWASSAGRSATSSWLAARSERVALWGAIAAYGAAFAAISIRRDHALETGRFDLGNMVQAVWATAHGHPLRITDLRGDQISRLAAHVDPILVLFAPFWRIWPSADLLLTVQAVAIALGALPVYRLARRHLGSERAALGFALAYLLYPPLQWLTLNEFHPVALATPLLLFAFDALDRDRLVPFAIYALLACTTKEEIPLVVAAMGLWYALARRRWAAGAAIFALGGLWTAIAVTVVIPHYNHGAASAFYSRYGEVGGTPSGILKQLLTHPLHVLETAFDGRGWTYLAQMTLPLALLFAAAPLAALVAVPELALNLLSATPTQTSIHFHYTAGAIAPLVAASVLGAGAIARRRPGLAIPLATVALLAALVANWHLGALPLWRAVPGGYAELASAPSPSAHDRIALRAAHLIPSGAVVSATNNLGAHLSARRRVLSFPYLEDATWVAADETQPGYADRIAPLPTAAQLVALRQSPAWKLVFEQDGVLVFKRILPP